MKQVTEDSALSRMPRTANASQWGHLLLLLHWALVITAARRPAQKPSRREVGLAERGKSSYSALGFLGWPGGCRGSW